MLGRALDPPLEKHQRAEWLWIALMLAQQVKPERKTYSKQTAKKPWRKKTHLQFSLTDTEILTQGRIQRTVGAQQEVIEPRALGLSSQSVYVVGYLLPIFSAGIFGRRFYRFASLHIQQQRGAVKNRLDFLRMKHVEQDEFASTVTEGLHGLYHCIRILIEVGDQNGNAPLLHKPLEFKKRAHEIRAFPQGRVVDSMQEPHELSLP